MSKKFVKLKVPSRFHIDIMNQKKIHSGGIGGGGIGIGIEMNNLVKVEKIEGEDDIIISKKDKLVKYIIDLMRDKLNIKDHFNVEFTFDKRIKSHNGMSSNAIVGNSVAFAINYLYENPLTKEEVINLLKSNYCEEENGNLISNVVYTGVSHNTISYGGMCFTDEDGVLLYSHKFSNKFKVYSIKTVCGDLFENENAKSEHTRINLIRNDKNRQFICPKEEIIKNEVIPELKKGNLIPLCKNMDYFATKDSSIIFSERCKINNMSYAEFRLKLKDIPNVIVRVASSSPYIIIVTDKEKQLKKICSDNNIELNEYDINNNGIEVIEEG